MWGQLAAVALVAAMLLGVVLLSATPRTAPLRLTHGVAGGAGVLLALAVWWHMAAPPVFAQDGVALAVAALLLGLGFWRFAARLGHGRMVVLALHGAAGATAACLFAAWAFGG